MIGACLCGQCRIRALLPGSRASGHAPRSAVCASAQARLDEVVQQPLPLSLFHNFQNMHSTDIGSAWHDDERELGATPDASFPFDPPGMKIRSGGGLCMHARVTTPMDKALAMGHGPSLLNSSLP